jgi:hypothetical protein
VEETVKFLFWNIQKKPLGYLVRKLVDEHDIDIVILAEVENPRAILDALSAGRGGRDFHTDPLPDTVSRRERRPFIFWRLGKDAVRLLRDTRGVIFRELVTTSHPSILVVAVHLPSLVGTREHDQLQEASRVGRRIRSEEARLGHQQTLVVGDFNMNPFDVGIMTADAFHAVMTQAMARGGSRQVRYEERAYFYNPMWGCLGDRTPGPPGTYYHDSPGHLPLFWNTFDQVLIRPDLLDVFDAGSLQVLERAEEVALLDPNSGRPNQRDASDHLPILFSLRVGGGNDHEHT